jgi:hypothetical protein
LFTVTRVIYRLSLLMRATTNDNTFVTQGFSPNQTPAYRPMYEHVHNARIDEECYNQRAMTDSVNSVVKRLDDDVSGNYHVP